MVSIVSSTPTAPETGEAAEQPKRSIPLMSIPLILAVGLVLAVGYVAIRVVQSRPQATALVARNQPQVMAVNRPVRPVAVKAVPDKPVEARPAPEITPSAGRANGADALASTPPRDEVPVLEEGPDTELISPQHGQRYLQIAAVSTRYSHRFLAEVSRYNVQARVAPGPKEDLVRVVIGPFSDRESLAAAKAQIQAKWPDCFARAY